MKDGHVHLLAALFVLLFSSVPTDQLPDYPYVGARSGPQGDCAAVESGVKKRFFAFGKDMDPADRNASNHATYSTIPP